MCSGGVCRSRTNSCVCVWESLMIMVQTVVPRSRAAAASFASSQNISAKLWKFKFNNYMFVLEADAAMYGTCEAVLRCLNHAFRASQCGEYAFFCVRSLFLRFHRNHHHHKTSIPMPHNIIQNTHTHTRTFMDMTCIIFIQIHINV